MGGLPAQEFLGDGARGGHVGAEKVGTGTTDGGRHWSAPIPWSRLQCASSLVTTGWVGPDVVLL